jgi:hypothetical protein
MVRAVGYRAVGALGSALGTAGAVLIANADPVQTVTTSR